MFGERMLGERLGSLGRVWDVWGEVGKGWKEVKMIGESWRDFGRIGERMEGLGRYQEDLGSWGGESWGLVGVLAFVGFHAEMNLAVVRKL